MIPPIIQPVPQFFDNNGDPLAGGTVETYEPGTSTPKTVWVDPEQTAVQTNPIVLNAAGSCTWYGDGDYRLVLRSAAGDLIWDQVGSTIVSAAMAPVVSAPTIADAVHLLGIDDLIAQEAADRAAADSAEQTARSNADAALDARISDEAAFRAAADDALSGRITTLEGAPAPVASSVQAGTASADSGGHVRVTFPTPFPTACTAFVATLNGTGLISDTFNAAFDQTGADVWVTEAGTPIGKPDGFSWIAVGH